MNRVFADTFYWLALSNPADQWHQAVRQAMEGKQDVYIVTTDEVLTEFLAAMAGRGLYQRHIAVRVVRSILDDASVTVLPQTRQSFLEGLALYERRADKGYSLTDCISMNVCRLENISNILTNDHHFTQEGFFVLISG